MGERNGSRILRPRSAASKSRVTSYQSPLTHYNVHSLSHERNHVHLCSRPQARPRPLGPGDVRHHRHPAHRPHARLRRLRQRQPGASRHLHPHRHGCDGVHRHQLRTHGARLSQRGLGLHLRRPRDPSRPRLRHRLEHDHGLHDQPAHLHHLVRQGHARLLSRSLAALVVHRLRAAVHAAQPARSGDLRAHQPSPVRRNGRRDRRLLWRHHPLFDVERPAHRGVLPATVLQSAGVYSEGLAARNVARGAHLHRLRRHLHPLRRSPQSQAQHPAGDGAGLRHHRHSRRRPRSTPRNCCAPDTASPRPKPSAPSPT